MADGRNRVWGAGMIATTQITLSGVPLQSEPLPGIPVPSMPVRVCFMNSDFTSERLYFRCQCYHPRGGDPDYVRKKYDSHSQDCSQTIRNIDGVSYHSPFICHKEHLASEWWPYCKFPDQFTPIRERQSLTAALKRLWSLA